MDLSVDENVADLRPEDELTTTSELDLDRDLSQPEPTGERDFGGTAFVLDSEDPEAELSLDRQPENVADLRQDEGEFTISEEALEPTPPETDLSVDDDTPTENTTEWGSATVAGGALGGAAGAFFNRENAPESKSIDGELISEDTTTESDLFGEFEPAAERTEFAEDAIASPDAATDSQEMTLEEMTLEDLENTSDISLEEITFGEPTVTSDLTLEEMTFDEPVDAEDLNLEEMTLEDLENTSDISLEEITFDEPTATSDLTLEEMTFDEPVNADESLVGDLEGLSSDVSLDDLGFEEVESPEATDNTFDPLRDNTADISSLDDDNSEDMDNISEWLESLETPKQDTEDISEWLRSLNTDETISATENRTSDSQLEEADDVSFQFLEDLLERDSKSDRDD